MSNNTKDLVERYVCVREDGAIKWESVLEKQVGRQELRRLLDIVADHVVEEGGKERIDWVGVWKEGRHSQ